MKSSIENSMIVSNSVQNARRFAGDERIASWFLVKELFNLHPDYAGGMGRKLSGESGPEGGELLNADEWIEQLYHLFDADRVPEIHGRLAILGLAKLDSALNEYLSGYGLIDTLQKELKEPFDELLQKQESEINAPPKSEYKPRTEKKVPETSQANVPTTAGYISDSVDAGAPDHLDIEREVANLSNVLTFKRVKPPLSLGLFGDWGSGKSFFIAKLQNHINKICDYYRKQEQIDKKATEWCSRVVQIDFNAWHFSDANLWASLVSRIYEKLHGELSDKVRSDKELREQLTDKMKLARGVLHEAELELKEAESRVNVATTSLHDAQNCRLEKETALNTLIGSIETLFKNNDKLRKQLEEAAKELGFPEAAKSYAALEDLNHNLKNFSNRLSSVATSLFRSPRTLLILALLVICLPILASVLLENYATELSAAGKRVAEISTFLFGIIAWLKVQIGKGLSLVENIETSLEQAQEIRQKQIDEVPKVKEAQQMLTLAQGNEQSARQNLQHSQSELQRLQSELQEMRPERKLSRLIEERERTATYSQHLGIISLIRTDFEKMSELLGDLAFEKRNFNEEPPIQRIILYIDDLDRCRPERVVEVLEAVHLLLAFPLFIVVVGVDPRWLRHSLAQHYQHTLTENGNEGVHRTSATPAYFSTPQDYLEKIFQIPFALRPVEKDGYEALVKDLLLPLPEPAQKDRSVQDKGDLNLASQPKREFSNSRDPENKIHQIKATETDTESYQGKESAELAAEKSFTPVNPRQMEFTDLEKMDIDRLWRMFRTPRTVKRFINTYRLLRAGLHSGEEVTLFEGTENHPGEYQVVLLLLVIVTSAPNKTDAFLSHLGEWLKQSSTENEKSKLWHWNDVLSSIRTTLVQDDPDWGRIMADLEQIIGEDFDPSFTKSTLLKWAWRVARYSFSVRPIQTLS